MVTWFPLPLRACLLLLLAGLALPACVADAQTPAPAGPRAAPGEYYHLRQGVTFYLANTDGEPFEAAIELKDINTFCQGPQTALVKLYAPDGAVLSNNELPDDGVTSGAYDQAWAGWDHEQWALGGLREAGAEPLFRWGAFSDPAKLDRLRGTPWSFKVEKAVKGVYQLQVVGCDDHFVSLAVKTASGRPIKFGVLGHPDFLAGHGDQFRTSYLYVPPPHVYNKNADGFDLWVLQHGYPRTRRLTLFRGSEAMTAKNLAFERDETVMTPGQAQGRYRVSLKDVAPGSVLKLVNEGDGDFLLRVNGIPPVYCPDEATAKFIAGGVIAIPDGPVVSFPWQADLWNAIKDWKREDLTLVPGEWNKMDPADVARLQLHQWERGNDPRALETEIAATQAALAKIEPFSMLKALEDPAVCSLVSGDTFLLYPLKGNGLYQNRQLKNLLTLALVRRWLYFRGGEVIWEAGELNVAYAQGFHWHNWEPVYLLKDHLSPALLKAFQTGAAQIAQRMFYANGLELVLSNGRTTVPLNLYHAYLITGDARFKDLSMRHLRRMTQAEDGPHAGGSRSGYFREHFAADGGYCTYPLYQLGRLVNISGEPEAFAAVENLCKWINYVTLPNGQGGYLNPTSWNARIAMGSIEHMWGHGYKYIASKSQWAANLYHILYPGKENYDVADPALEPGKPAPEKPVAILTSFTRGVLPAKPLPAESAEPFYEDVGGGGEFFAVRRGNYYAICYAGKRVPFWMDLALGGMSSFNGGGLAGLSVRGAAGAVIVGRVNREYGWPLEEWNTLAVPVAVGTLSDGRVFNTGVSRNTPAMDKKSWTLTTTGECVSAPVNYERSYRFDEGVISARIVVGDAALEKDVFQYRAFFRKPTVQVAQAWELLPFIADSGAKVRVFDASGKALGELGEAAVENVSSLEISRGVGGVRVKLDKPRTVKLSASPASLASFKEAHAVDLRSRAVQIKIGEKAGVGGTVELRYELTPYEK